MCGADLLLGHDHHDYDDDDDDGTDDDDESADDEEENEPSWKLYAVTVVYLVDDCLSGATVESDSA